jgi:hypothetical protein
MPRFYFIYVQPILIHLISEREREMLGLQYSLRKSATSKKRKSKSTKPKPSNKKQGGKSAVDAKPIEEGCDVQLGIRSV